MASLLNNATIKVRRDITSNWSSNNPTLKEGEWGLDTDLGLMKVGDGSTAWNSLSYFIPAVKADTNDLTSSNITYTLPAITGAPQTISFYWTNGGTYKLTLAVTGAPTVGGLSASIWEGEGEGHMVVESDGSNWMVREYEDSGSNSNGNWQKQLDGTQICIFASTSDSLTNITHGNIFESGPISLTFPLSFNLAPHILTGCKYGFGRTWGGMTNIITISSFNIYLFGSTSASKGYPYYTATGRWRT